MPHHSAFRPQVVIIQGGRAQQDAYDWVEYLNGLLELDPEWTAELVNHRPRCNYKVATHPTAQVMNLNQLDEILADQPPAEPEPVPYDNKTRYEDSEPVVPAPASTWLANRRGPRGVVYDTEPEAPVPSPSRDADGSPVTPGFHSAMNKSLAGMPDPRWACGMLGVINGFLGIAEGGKGPIAAEVDTTTGRISRFFVTEPYERIGTPVNNPEKS